MFNDEHDDGVDRRGFLRCMAWAGTGALFMVDGGVLKSYSLSKLPKLACLHRNVLAQKSIGPAIRLSPVLQTIAPIGTI